MEFNRDTFTQFLGHVRDSFRDAYRSYARITLPGGCGAYFGWLRVWMVEAPGFTNVPAEWNALYYEYRSWIQQAFTATEQHRLRCAEEFPESLTTEQIDGMAEFFNGAYQRLEVMIVEAEQMPR